MRKVLPAIAVVIGCAGMAQAQGMDMMQFADGNGDGKVTEAEFATFAEQGWSYITQDAPQVTLADIDPMMQGSFRGVIPAADGTITRAAYLAASPARFKALDKNGDGTLDGAEVNAMMAPAG